MRGVSGFHNSQRRDQQLPSGIFPIKESIEAPELHRGVRQGSRGGSGDGVLQFADVRQHVIHLQAVKCARLGFPLAAR